MAGLQAVSMALRGTTKRQTLREQGANVVDSATGHICSWALVLPPIQHNCPCAALCSPVSQAEVIVSHRCETYRAALSHITGRGITDCDVVDGVCNRLCYMRQNL